MSAVNYCPCQLFVVCSLQMKEQKVELAQANEAAAEGDAKLTKLAADHKRLAAKAEALQQEVRSPEASRGPACHSGSGAAFCCSL